METNLHIEAWERQMNEPTKSWTGFQEFRDMGENRSINVVAEIYGWSATYTQKLAHKWRWTERVAEFENAQINQEIIAQKNAIKEMNRRHVRAATSVMPTLLQVIKGVDKIIKEGALEEMNPEAQLNFALKAVPLLNVLVDIERKAMGEATNITQNDITSNGKNITVILPPVIADKDKEKLQEEDDEEEAEFEIIHNDPDDTQLNIIKHEEL